MFKNYTPQYSLLLCAKQKIKMEGKSLIKQFTNNKDFHCGIELTLKFQNQNGLELIINEPNYLNRYSDILYGINYYIEYQKSNTSNDYKNMQVEIKRINGHGTFWTSMMITFVQC